MQRHKKAFCIIFLLAVVVICFITCTGNSNQTSQKDPRGELYAGSAACISCHKEVADSYIHTGHSRSSSKASYAELAHVINATDKVVSYENNQQVQVEESGLKFFQSYFVNGNRAVSKSMDIVFGSGEDAQTYGYWHGSQLFELPLTYLTSRKMFTNSPGFPIDKPYYTRVIPSRCLECHSSFVNTMQVREKGLLQIHEQFDSSSILYGIDCERCHGPGAQHVQFQKNNPSIKEAKFIADIKSLTRQQQLDLCASCHSGDPVEMHSIFGFAPGDTLSKFYLSFSNGNTEPDAHGMQMQALAQSECFRKSNLTCITCHQPHQTEENVQAFILKCMSCHQQSAQHAVKMNSPNDNCITCHMPLQASRTLDFNNQTRGNNISYMLRTHNIAVYKGK